jgi:hypothetical protein
MRACEELGIEPKFELKEFKDELYEELFVYDSNLARRRMSPFNRVMLAMQREPLIAQIAQQQMKAGVKLSRNQERVDPDKQLAKDSHTSKDTVYKSKQIYKLALENPDKKLELGRAGIDTDSRTSATY